MAEAIKKIRRVFITTETRHPITQFATYIPTVEDRQKGHRDCVIDLNMRTGQFVLPANAQHYDKQMEAIGRLIEMGRIAEVPQGKEMAAGFKFDVQEAEAAKGQSHQIKTMQKELTDKMIGQEADFGKIIDEKDQRIANLEAELAKRK